MSEQVTIADDPIGYFLDDMEYLGKAERTHQAYARVLRDFETQLEAPLAEASHRDCMAFIHRLRRDQAAASTIATYASYLHRFFAYMMQVGAFESNPMALVLAEIDESVDTNPSRRDIDVAEMRQFVRGVRHPLDQAVIVTLLKTGMRVGELCNLDLRDLTTQTQALSQVASADVEPRAVLYGRGPSLYVDSMPTRGGELGGERRTASNKRRRATVVPVDDELEAVLLRWLRIRPDVRSPAEPLFTSTSGAWGSRLSPDMVHHIVEQHARAAGWHRSGASAAENVTPHYFRHFFTTHLRDRTGDRGIVKYLRGDVGGDIIDTYTHNWGDRVRETYLQHIYRLL
jgi:integrase